MSVVSRLPRLVLALLLACAAALVSTQAPAAAACTCADAGVKKLAQRADVVFRGTLIAQTVNRRNRVYTLEVRRIYQGRVASAPVQVVSPRKGASCGLGSLRVDRSYVVFGQQADTRVSSDLCDGTQRATPAYVDRVESVLGPGNPLPEGQDPSAERPAVEFTPVEHGEPPDITRLAAPGAALVLVGLLGLFVFRRRG